MNPIEFDFFPNLICNDSRLFESQNYQKILNIASKQRKNHEMETANMTVKADKLTAFENSLTSRVICLDSVTILFVPFFYDSEQIMTLFLLSGLKTTK